jgi:hypothetical protein
LEPEDEDDCTESEEVDAEKRLRIVSDCFLESRCSSSSDMRGPQKLSSFTNESTNAFEEGEATSEDTSPVEVLVGSLDMFAMVWFVEQQFCCIFVSEFEFMRR